VCSITSGCRQGAILRGIEKIPRLPERYNPTSGRIGHCVRRLQAQEEGAGGDRGQEADISRRSARRRKSNHGDQRGKTGVGFNTRQEEAGETEEDQESGGSTSAGSREAGCERRGDQETSRSPEEDTSAAEAAREGEPRTGTAAATATTSASGDGPLERRLRERGDELFLATAHVTAENVPAHGTISAADERRRLLRPEHERQQSVQHERQAKPGAPAALQPESQVHVAVVHAFRPVVGNQYRDFVGEQPGTIAAHVA